MDCGIKYLGDQVNCQNHTVTNLDVCFSIFSLTRVPKACWNDVHGMTLTSFNSNWIYNAFIWKIFILRLFIPH